MDIRPVPVQGLFETHFTVSNLQRSITFYRDFIGLELGQEVPERNCAFFWVGESKRSMIGLWSIGTMPHGLVLHIAFEVTLDDLLSAPRRLRSNGVTPMSFFGQETYEPSTLCWMPAASVFFREPDGHLVEYLAMLNEEPKPALGIIPWSIVPIDELAPDEILLKLETQKDPNFYFRRLKMIFDFQH